MAEMYLLRDLDAFRAHVVRAVSKIVPADVIIYTQVGPHGEPTARVAHPGDVVSAELLNTFARHMHEHPLVRHFSENPQARVAKVSDFLTQRELHRLGLYREFFREIDVEYQVVIRLPAPSPWVSSVALSRNGPDFSERDQMLLSALQPHIVQAHVNAEALSQMKQEAAQVLTGLEEVGQGIILLRSDGGVRLTTQLARRWLTTYFDHPALQPNRLPEALERWVEFRRSGDDIAPPKPLVVEGPESRLNVRMIPAAGGSVLVLDQQRTVLKPASLEALGLSRREAEVLAWVAQGKTDAAIGAILSLSPRTVGKHLEHIYERLGVENRLAAAAQAFTTSLATS